MKFVLFLSWITTIIAYTYAIRCNFTYTEVGNMASANTLLSKSNRLIDFQVKKGGDAFECDNEIDDEYDRVYSIQTEVRFNHIDGYEREEPECKETKKFIQPQGLNNIYNKFTTVEQIVTIQKIQVTECIEKDANCSKENVPDNKKVICYQEFSKIQLKARKEDNQMYDEFFYYPSACSCATFRKKPQ